MEYDFSTLSHTDFEKLTRDLIGRELALRFEAFPEGPDDGMDGRHSSADGVIILQSKHYHRSGLSTLKSKMKKERAAIDALQAKRYILATSTPLTPKNKNVLAAIIGPSLLSPGDIFGPDDLNALLRKYPDIETSHPELWGRSTAVLSKVVTGAVADALPQASPKSALPKLPFILPQTPNPNFTGRAKELEQLEEMLLSKSAGNVSSIAGLSGTGGIGKSALAVHFAKKHRDHFPDGVIGLRVDGKDPEPLSRAFARHLGMDVEADDERSAQEIMQAAFGRRKCLLIFDNADAASVRHLLPGGATKVIVTTRDRGLPIALNIPPAARVDVAVLPKEDALDLLRAEHGERIDREQRQAERLHRLVGGLPLALEVVSAILSLEPWRRLQDLVDELETERKRLSTLSVEGMEHLDVRASFNLSIARMTDEEVCVFASASTCDPAGFTARAAAAASEADTASVMKTLSRLRRFSVLNEISGKNPPRFVFHPLMLELAAELALDRGIAGAAAERHAKYYMDFFGSRPFSGDGFAEASAELGEAVIAALWSAENRIFDPRFVFNLQEWLDRAAMWHDAIDVLEAYHQKEENVSDEETRLHIANQLAKFLVRIGSFDAAAEVLETTGFVDHSSAGSGRSQAVILNTYGGVLQRQGKFDAAVEAFRKSELIERRLENPRGQAVVLTSLGGVLQRQGKFVEAAQALREAASIEAHLENPRGRAMVLNSLGGILQREGEFEEAAEAFKDARELLAEDGDERGVAMVLNSLGGVLQRQGKFDAAVEAFETAAEIEERLDNRRGQAMVLNSLGGVLQRQGKFDEAVEAFERSHKLLVKQGDLRGQAMVLNSLGGVLQRQGKFDGAVEAFERSREISEGLNDQRSLGMVLNSLGGVLQRQGKFDEAVEAFKRSREISEGLDDGRSIAMVLNSLGGVLQRQGKFDEAVKAFRKSAAIGEAISDRRHLAMALNSLGGVLQRQGKFDAAVEAFEAAAEIEDRLDNRRGQAMVLNSLGGVLQRQGKFDEAVEALERSHRLLVKQGDLRGQAMVLNGLGGAYQRIGRVDEADGAFRSSIALGERLNDSTHLAKVHTAFGRALLQRGAIDSALDELKRGFELDERARNRRGLRFVVPPLVEALQRAGRKREAEDILQRAIKISPEDDALMRAPASMKRLGSADRRPTVRMHGRVKRLLEPMGRPRFGFILPDGGGPDIYFSERTVGTKVFSSLAINQRVSATVVETDRGLEARVISP